MHHEPATREVDRDVALHHTRQVELDGECLVALVELACGCKVAQEGTARPQLLHEVLHPGAPGRKVVPEATTSGTSGLVCAVAHVPLPCFAVTGALPPPSTRTRQQGGQGALVPCPGRT